jgi:hypothetical protein
VVESKSGSHERMSPNWGFVAAGVLWPSLTKVVTHWLPLHYAAAVTTFVLFYAAYWLFSWTPPRTGRGMVARLAIAGTAGVVAGLMGFWFPW